MVLGNSTKDGTVLFAKNSDREPNEAHNILYLPRKKYEKDAKVNCTYLSLPQVEETNEVLLLKPFWIFGCEMGANEHGVTIGNEAVWSKEPYREKGLLGMDMMRLALERTDSAKAALDLIISLLEEYGQGGACGYTDKKLFYHNSFIIADPQEAWVLETADKYWIAEKVKDIRTISNTLTIQKEYDLIHPELISHAIKEGYCKTEFDFNFAKNFIPRFNIKQMGAKGAKRIACTTEQLRKYRGKITPEIMMATLRAHNISPSEEKDWAPHKSSMKSPCMHYTSFITPSQSTGSHVAHLKKNFQVHWVTGTSAPCTSTFKPIILPQSGITFDLEKAEQTYNPETLWWHHEKLHRLVLKDYQKRLHSYLKQRNALEVEFLKQVRALSPSDHTNIQKLQTLTREAFEKSREKTTEWIELVQSLPIEVGAKKRYLKRWQKLNAYDNMDLDMLE
mgnify:CR=1 FL=1